MIKSAMAEKLWSKLEKTLVNNGKAFISVTGGGGKTTFLVSFSSYLKSLGYSVLITTSTKLASPFSFDYKVDGIFLSPSIINYWPKKGESVFYGSYNEALVKTTAPPSSMVSLLYDRYDVVIVEADGSRRLPLKIHTQRDPVIWKPTTAIVAVSGLWAYGKPIKQSVFGPEEKSGLVDKSYYEYLIGEPEGMAKGMSPHTDNVFLFNGGDVVEERVRKEMKTLSLPYSSFGFIVSMNKDEIYETL